jgi:hypothetical protein
MSNSKALHYLATHPAEYAKFTRTGKLPRERVPQSPLIDLLQALGAGNLGDIRGLTVDHRLGYNGSRTFQFGTQALRWLCPTGGLYGHQTAPSESWQDGRFQKKGYVQNLVGCSSPGFSLNVAQALK